MACNAILGIDGDVVDPFLDAGLIADGAVAAIDGDLAEGAAGNALTLSLSTSTISLGQADSVDVTVTVDRPIRTDRIIQISVEGLPANVKTTVPSLKEGESGTVHFTAALMTARATTPIKIVATDRERTEADVPLTVTGAVDTTFGNNGYIHLGMNSDQDMSIEDVGLVVDGDGKILVAFAKKRGPGEQFALRRLTADGKLDPDFSDGGIIYPATTLPTARPRDMIQRPDETLLVLGDRGMDTSRVSNGPFAMVITPDGGVVERLPDTGSTDSLAAATLVPDGSGGAFLVGSAPDAGVLYRVGTSVAAGPEGAPTVMQTPALVAPWGVANDAAGHVLVFGTVGTGSQLRGVVERRDGMSGDLDVSFGDGGVSRLTAMTGANSTFGGAVLDSGIYATGSSTIDGGARLNVTRLTLEGAPDPSFNDGGSLDVVTGKGQMAGRALMGLPSGALLVAGYAGSAGLHRAAVTKVLANGIVDPNFGVGGTVTFVDGLECEARRMAKQGSSVIVAGMVSLTTQSLDVYLMRLTP